jgi:hypothetical protein
MQTPRAPPWLTPESTGCPKTDQESPRKQRPQQAITILANVWGSRETDDLEKPADGSSVKRQLRDTVISAWHRPSSHNPPRAEVALHPLRQFPPHIEGPGGTEKRYGRHAGQGQVSPEPAPSHDFDPNGWVQPCSAPSSQRWDLRRTRYRPNMGVTSSMLLGLEYAAGLREGNGRSELVP